MRPPRTAAVVLVLAIALAVVLVAGGCRQVAGIDEREVAAQCSAATYQHHGCGECTEIACCAQLERCKGQAQCAAAYGCIARCAPTDQECRSRCRTEHAKELTRELADVLACQSRECTAACEFTCAGNIGSHASCAECMATRCCDAERACNRDADCIARRFCRIRCDADPSCNDREACNATIPEGRDADLSLQYCQSNDCAAGCTNWTCLGQPTAAPAPPMRIGVEVLDANAPGSRTGGTPVPGIRVRTCGPLTVVCDEPDDFVTVTNQQGRAEVVLTQASAFAGHFLLTSDDDAWVPTLVYPWRSIASDATVPVRILRRSDLPGVLAGYGVTPSPDRGLVAVHLRDCAGGESAGVELSLEPRDPRVVGFTMVDGRFGARGTVTATDGKFALGGFVDVAPGGVRIRGTVTRRGDPLVPLDIHVSVQPGYLTFIDHDARR